MSARKKVVKKAVKATEKPKKPDWRSFPERPAPKPKVPKPAPDPKVAAPPKPPPPPLEPEPPSEPTPPPVQARKERCGTCRFFTTAPRPNLPGTCHQSPAYHRHQETDWCGAYLP